MYYINSKPNEKGKFSSPQSTPFKGSVILPDELLEKYFEYKRFVFITVENDVVTNIEPNTEALETWQAAQIDEPEPVSVLEQLRADVDYIAIMTGVKL